MLVVCCVSVVRVVYVLSICVWYSEMVVSIEGKGLCIEGKGWCYKVGNGVNDAQIAGICNKGGRVAYTHVHPCTPMYTYMYTNIPRNTHVNPSVHPCTRISTQTFQGMHHHDHYTMPCDIDTHAPSIHMPKHQAY